MSFKNFIFQILLEFREEKLQNSFLWTCFFLYFNGIPHSGCILDIEFDYSIEVLNCFWGLLNSIKGSIFRNNRSNSFLSSDMFTFLVSGCQIFLWFEGLCKLVHISICSISFMSVCCCLSGIPLIIKVLNSFIYSKSNRLFQLVFWFRFFIK